MIQKTKANDKSMVSARKMPDARVKQVMYVLYPIFIDAKEEQLFEKVAISNVRNRRLLPALQTNS